MFYARVVRVTGQQLTARARAHLGEDARTWARFAIAIGLRGTDEAGGSRLKRWSKGTGEPDYEGTIKLLDSLNAINWEVVLPESAKDVAARVGEKSDRARGRIENQSTDLPHQAEGGSRP